MPYIERNPEGEIIALHRESVPLAQEFLAATTPEVVAFLSIDANGDQPKLALAESDADIARVTEDLIHLLIAKNLIIFTELPEPVQRKLLAREKMRTTLHNNDFFLLDDTDTI